MGRPFTATGGGTGHLVLQERHLLGWQGFRSAVYAATILTVGIAVLIGRNGNYDDVIFVFAGCFAIVVVGMVVEVGYSHQLAFHQAVFMMVGAYGVAVLNIKYGWPVWSAMIVSVLGCALIAAIIGSYITRVPGFALALVTLFFSTIVGEWIVYVNYLGAGYGLGPVASVWNGTSSKATFELTGLIVVILLALAVFVASRVMSSSIGLELALMSRNEPMAEALGVRTARRKLELFVFGSALAGLGGAAFATTQHFINPNTFGSQTVEITFIVMLYFGGRNSIIGGLVGAFLIEYISGLNNFVAENQGIIEGVLITAVLVFAPSGLAGVFESAWLPVSSWATARLERIRLIPARATVAAVIAEPAPPAPRVGGRLQTVVADATAVAKGDEASYRIECRGVTKRFGGVVAVDNVSLAIAGRGIHAVCGPNGAGKSTLFEVIAGGLGADAGQVLVRGIDVTKWRASQRAGLGIARTFQAVQLMQGRSVLDNVAVAAVESHHTFLTRALFRSGLNEARERAHSALVDLGIENLASRRPSQLTLEAQRMVELARAVVSSPEIILLDEPASGLSVEQRVRLADTLTLLSQQTTIILVEHDLEMVARIAQEIFVLLQGKLAFHGDADAFLASEVVRAELMGLVDDEMPVGRE